MHRKQKAPPQLQHSVALPLCCMLQGTPAGDIPIPEAAGLAVGCSFLLCIICFELLHYYDIGSLLDFIVSALWAQMGRCFALFCRVRSCSVAGLAICGLS